MLRDAEHGAAGDEVRVRLRKGGRLVAEVRGVGGDYRKFSTSIRSEMALSSLGKTTNSPPGETQKL